MAQVSMHACYSIAHQLLVASCKAGTGGAARLHHGIVLLADLYGHICWVVVAKWHLQKPPLGSWAIDVLHSLYTACLSILGENMPEVLAGISECSIDKGQLWQVSQGPGHAPLAQ